MLTKDCIHSLFVFWVNVAKDDRLSRTHDGMEIVLIHEGTDGRLETEVSLILHTSIVNVLSVKQLAIALLPPSHPITVLPLCHWPPRSDFFTNITLHKSLELVNTKSVHQILHTGIGTNITVAVITLSSHNSLHHLHDVLLRYKAHVIRSTCKRVLLVMGTPHTSTNHNIESLKFTGIVANHNYTNIIGVNIQRVVSRNGNTNLELPGKILRSVNRFRRVR
mmetsp:Transcript_17701/g.38240  ORF Transcript_17701/g.38240 Transcript_17701/m.38240 type:complete len:221 (-) Transcript_17701:330-992(-)